MGIGALIRPDLYRAYMCPVEEKDCLMAVPAVQLTMGV